MNEIVDETSLSKGTVNNIIQQWKARINGTDIQEIRGFIVEVRKSGMSLKECAQAFRIANTLKKLNVYDEFDEGILDGDYNGQTETGPLTQTGQKKIMVEDKAEIEEEKDKENDYLGFKKRDIIGQIRSVSSTPQTSSITNHTKTNNLAEEDQISDAKGYQIDYFINTIYKNCKYHGIKPSIIIEWILDLFHFYTVSSESSTKQINNHHFHNQNQNHYQNLDLKDTNEDIPLVSKVSLILQQKKKEIQHLVDTKTTIIQEINRLNAQKEKIRINLSGLVKQERRVISYIQWYNNLKQELRNKFNLVIELEFELFARVINDLKNHDYNVPQIILEYKDLISIRQQRDTLKGELDSINRAKQHLLNDINELKDKEYSYTQTLKTFNELQKMGFELPKLKQLRGLILEISSINNIDPQQAISKFFKDIEKNYDKKLGFELKIIEIQIELEQLDNKVREKHRILAMQDDPAAPNLPFLYFQGLTSDDIVGFTYLILSLDNSYSLDYKSIKKKFTYINTNNDNNLVEKKEFWKLIVNRFKDLSSINVEIERAKTHLQELQNNINGHTRTQF